MNKKLIKGLAITLTGTLLVSSMVLFGQKPNKVNEGIKRENTVQGSIRTAAQETSKPKYIFLFIGDGMSYPQIQSTADFLGKDAKDKVSVVQNSSNKEDSPYSQTLPFMNFPVAGSAQTYDATSFAPDSASTATSISTGYKTHSGTINMDITKKIKYETIAEKLKKQMGYKVGIVSSVNLNHATPAAFYAHQPTRKNNYPIGQELIASNFDYFAGGAFMEPKDKDNDKEDIYSLAKKAGYKVIKTEAEAEKLTKADGKAIVIGETLADADALSYENDRKKGEWALADYVEKGIEVLDNDKGFFMMVEGGKIDWAGHANDAGSVINDTMALSNSVDKAIEFYNQHPYETLIIVTGDHETGGLTIGYAGTDYDTYLDNLENQKISYAKFDSDYVTKYKKNKTPFTTVLKDIKSKFGLMTEKDKDAKSNPKLVLTTYEYNKLKAAYDKTMSKKSADRNQEEYELYGSYEPLTVTITHILNNKSGIAFTTYSHTGLPVPVFAQGAGQQLFEGYYDNTDIYKNLATLTGVK